MTDRAANHPDLPTVLAVLLAGLVFVAAVRRSSPLAEISPDQWQCTARRPEQQPVDTPRGPTFRTVYACDQWSRR